MPIKYCPFITFVRLDSAYRNECMSNVTFQINCGIRQRKTKPRQCIEFRVIVEVFTLISATENVTAWCIGFNEHWTLNTKTLYVICLDFIILFVGLALSVSFPFKHHEFEFFTCVQGNVVRTLLIYLTLRHKYTYNLCN